MSRVVHFEFATPDPERESEFFRTLFGWHVGQWAGREYWLVDTSAGDTGRGINGAILPQTSPDQPRTVNTIGVADIDETIAKALAAGGSVALEKQDVPGVGQVASLASPTGVVFNVIQPAPGSSM